MNEEIFFTILAAICFVGIAYFFIFVFANLGLWM